MKTGDDSTPGIGTAPGRRRTPPVNWLLARAGILRAARGIALAVVGLAMGGCVDDVRSADASVSTSGIDGPVCPSGIGGVVLGGTGGAGGGAIGTGGAGDGGSGGQPDMGGDWGREGPPSSGGIDANTGGLGAGGTIADASGGSGGGGGTTTGTACTTQAPPPVSAFLVEDFERGPGLQRAEPDRCMKASFNGARSLGDGGVQACDWPGVNPSSCNDGLFCEGNQWAGICPVYIRRDECAWRGDYSLRLLYNIDGADGAFAGIMLHIANKQDPSTCWVNRQPIDLTNYEFLSLRVRPGDAKGNAEIALQDQTSGTSGLAETDPKVVLTSSTNTFAPPLVGGMLRQGQWTEVRIRVCDLLKRKPSSGADGGAATAGSNRLDRTAITKVLVDFAKDRFITENTDILGTRQLDIDDVMFLHCETTGCSPCP